MLVDFIRESNMIEGIIHNPSNQEVQVYVDFLDLDKITVQDLEHFVSKIQPNAELRRKVGTDVRVGNHIPMLGGHQVEIELTNLLNGIHYENSYLTHLKYENLHPFTDGNGRSGRALWLWQRKSIPRIGFLHTFYYQTLQNNQLQN